MDSTNILIKHNIALLLSRKATNDITDKKYFISTIRRGSNKVHSQGDVIISLKPISTFLNQNGQDDVSCEDFLQDLDRKLPIIAKIDFAKGLCKAFLTRSLILSSTLPLVEDALSDYWMKLKNLFGVNVKILVEGNSQSVTQYRCNLIANHVMQIFKLSGATVQCLPLADASDNSKVNEVTKENEIGDSVGKGDLRKKLKPEENIYKYIVTENCHTDVKKANNRILCSHISDKSGKSKLHLNFEDYGKHLVKELCEASKHKYGKIDDCSTGNDYFTNTAKSCLTIQFMSVSHLSPIKVEIDERTQNSREGAFILYNHARLCMLFSNMQTLIDEGVLPELIPVQEVDFALLKHPEEWELFWVYVHKYPELFRELMEDIMEKSMPFTSNIATSKMILDGDGESKLQFNQRTSCSDPQENKIVQLPPKCKITQVHFPTHNLTKFLHSLAHCLSIYYNRVHILPARPSTHNGPIHKLPSHLIPVLWARVYLLKSVKAVMQSCFDTLGIVPPTTM